jgi:flagellar protein FlaG
MEIKGAGQTATSPTESTGLQPVIRIQATGQGQGQAEPPKESAPRTQAPQDLQRTLEHVAARLREYLAESRRDLEFRVDRDAGATVITVRNVNTGEVVRQIPNEEALRVLRRLNEGSSTFLDLTA